MNEQLNTGEIIIYQTEDGHASLEVNLAEDTVWLNLNQMTVLFDRDKSLISRHINSIFKEGELEKRQLLQILQQLLRMEKPIKLDTLISMLLSLLATELNRKGAPSSASGLTTY